MFLKGISLVSVVRTSKADTGFQRAARTTGRQKPCSTHVLQTPIEGSAAAERKQIIPRGNHQPVLEQPEVLCPESHIILGKKDSILLNMIKDSEERPVWWAGLHS